MLDPLQFRDRSNTISCYTASNRLYLADVLHTALASPQPSDTHSLLGRKNHHGSRQPRELCALRNQLYNCHSTEKAPGCNGLSKSLGCSSTRFILRSFASLVGLGSPCQKEAQMLSMSTGLSHFPPLQHPS